MRGARKRGPPHHFLASTGIPPYIVSYHMRRRSESVSEPTTDSNEHMMQEAVGATVVRVLCVQRMRSSEMPQCEICGPRARGQSPRPCTLDPGPPTAPHDFIATRDRLCKGRGRSLKPSPRFPQIDRSSPPRGVPPSTLPHSFALALDLPRP